MDTYKSRNDYLAITLKQLGLVYLLFILVFFLFRLGFAFYFGDQEVWDNYKGDVLWAFFVGWKYDTLVSSYIIFPVFLLLSFVSFIKNLTLYNLVNKFLVFYFVLFILAVNLVLIADLGFFSFYQDHINILFFGLLEDDTEALVKSVWDNYPLGGVLLGGLVYFLVLYKVVKSIFKKVKRNGSLFKEGVLFYLLGSSILCLLLFGGARGGYGKLVLSPKYADFSENEFVNLIALNGVVALEKSYKLRRTNDSLDFNVLKSVGYGDNVHQAFSDFLGLDVTPTKEENLIDLIARVTPKNEVLEEDPPHVIVFVMESFGSSWMDYNSDTFDFVGGLKKHFSEDIYFKNFLSSDNGTIGSLMTLTTNIPLRPGARHLSQSRYMRLPLETASHIPYKSKGYETTFLYGGKLGWRGIGKYYRHQKYDHIIGENAIRKKLSLNGVQGTEWGLYDEHFFDYISNQLAESSSPQFMIGLSTTNHPPFKVPKNYKGKRLLIPTELDKRITRERGLFVDRFRAFQYSNDKLNDFIEKIKNGPLKDKVIIAVTGDHNFWGFMTYSKSESFSMHKVPFYMYIPKRYYEGEFNPNKIGSHKDLMTTLYNVSLSETKYLSFGENLLIPGNDSYAFNGKVLAGQEGVILRGKKFRWNKIPFIESINTEEEFKSIDLRYKSTLSVADYYLRMMFDRQKEE